MTTRLFSALAVLTGLALAGPTSGEEFDLPEPETGPGPSVSRALDRRHSVRDFGEGPLSLQTAAQLLWAAQGLNRHRRTAPSAGALYPLTAYLVAGEVESLAPGVYRYHPREHRLDRIAEGDRRPRLAEAALNQIWVRKAPATLVLAADYAPTTGKYGRRGRRYVHMEVGHAAQNVYLQAEALDLGTVMVGAFSDPQVTRIVGLEGKERPLALMPVGPHR